MMKLKNIINESRPTDLVGIFRDMWKKSGRFEKLVDMKYISSGVIGFLRDKTGNAYEVVIRPAAHAKFKKVFGKSIGESIARPMAYTMEEILSDINYMLEVGEEEGVYSKPKEAMKLLKQAKNLLLKIK